MRAALCAAGILLAAGVAVSGHRLDEYLQATLLSVEPGRVEAEIRLTPGVAVFPAVFAAIDTDGDGSISGEEQTAYAARVLRDLSLAINGDPLRLTLLSAVFPDPREMKEGLGEIRIAFRSELPRGGPSRTLTFRNRHQSAFAAYLVNTLVPRDPRVQIVAQQRSQDQSVYRLDYVQAGAAPRLLSAGWWSGGRIWTAMAALILLSRLLWIWAAARRPRTESY